MLKILIPTIMLFPTIWLTTAKWLWPTALTQSLVIAFASLSWLKSTSETGWAASSPYMATDPLSTPLLVLSCWLLPLMILASQNHMSSEPVGRQRTYITLLASLQACLIMAFAATELLMFYVMFEATLIPTAIIITRWGNQAERLDAGTNLLFFTLISSLPLLVALLFLQNEAGTLSLVSLQFAEPAHLCTWADKLWWAACITAFLVKMPLYGLHLWLPKAHVEAPIAGSMVLAAVLLKLGGYGIMRMMLFLDPLPEELITPIIMVALWGAIMTGVICLRQTDLKALIAYSSVGHMGLVISGILVQTAWGCSGAIALMIAHGLSSSALFCLANLTYERTQSRTILLTRGTQMALPLTAIWWFISTLSNLALPPLPNLMGELTITTALFDWSPWTIIILGLAGLITAAYSLYLFLASQRGPLPSHMIALEPTHTREHLLLALHLFPTLLLTLKPELMWGWCF
uniref:NADH-ubiquinone oxidoreductase chain 4 n=4 Tax=Salangidae TaxID=182234 RepID=A0A024A2P6_9TELE|nr:NADH dehydrogenase subunit 4 [Neosalanx taihuensis]YP_009029970.1 NADH dehydrogenase subunit 4 [Protosalanx hyalocranius]YP_009121442.1 NADH dehydrogenase subunit 4 [Neosalanx tangkahkeii]YP_009641728.1 NADH dehydrogenase subunit 4 [Protosalanx chinensis]AFU89137.1 NADH dehydrogenase subunit 4 [Neosalanx taihuensis]AHY86310.1 NADH dehydrogenase subunit 4 [Protosalanx hyalocranius]AJF41801.1 NADH dehydrogenase subunit 4 [Neosalanx tangkahkeii]QBZ37840.1 NADH dehydrogenase subunit 4 [Protos